jgi:NADPH-dependent ferric siderophore reductase
MMPAMTLMEQIKTGEASTGPGGSGRAPRHPPDLWRVPVLRTERVTPRMLRITIGGEALATFPGGGGDQHVVLYFYNRDAVLPEPLTLTSARTMFGQVRPAMRSYTVRRHDPTTNEIDIDFVLHGAPVESTGPGRDWAAVARPGDQLIVVGPSPAYRPDPTITEQVFVGDETALPAIATMLAELPSTVRADVVLEVADAAEEQPLPTAADVTVTWLHRDGRPAGTAERLLDVVRTRSIAADALVWAAGERSAMQTLRTQLLTERRLDRRRVRTATYWRLGHAG